MDISEFIILLCLFLYMYLKFFKIRLFFLIKLLGELRLGKKYKEVLMSSMLVNFLIDLWVCVLWGERESVCSVC